MKTTDEQREELRRKQHEATPGPWRWWDSCSFRRLSSDATGKDGDVLHASVHRDGVADVIASEANKAFIAAANPEMVGALLDDVDELRAQLDDARHVIAEMEKNREEAIDITTHREYAQQAEIAELRERVRALEAENARLNACAMRCQEDTSPSALCGPCFAAREHEED